MFLLFVHWNTFKDFLFTPPAFLIVSLPCTCQFASMLLVKAAEPGATTSQSLFERERFAPLVLWGKALVSPSLSWPNSAWFVWGGFGSSCCWDPMRVAAYSRWLSAIGSQPVPSPFIGSCCYSSSSLAFTQARPVKLSPSAFRKHSNVHAGNLLAGENQIVPVWWLGLF